MDEINETLIAMAAENYADSLERRGCAFWQGLYRGYIAGYRACEGKESPGESGNCIKPDVSSSVCTCGHYGIESVKYCSKCGKEVDLKAN